MKILKGLLWVAIIGLSYMVYKSVVGPVEFNKVKEERYIKTITNLKDIRNSQLAYRTVTGKFANTFDELVRFIDTAHFTITQRRDSSIVDKEMTKRYGVTTYKDLLVIDTIGTVPVKDSLFKSSTRYKTMMNIPIEGVNAKFEMKADLITQNNIKIPVFEVKVAKDILLFDQDKNLLVQENQVVSVDGVNGTHLKVGSLTEVNTNGNWPKIFGSNDE
ncbi:MAG: hypothetical protein CO119_11975 [Flavobacteriales bacterium CG_4_9_14_3_um_filter_40_17]|nr:MAG: hypothetical protein CO119_11975 [Flavobacteriales bacterium CG_4_9_14_3_um_filter_40_17]